VIARYLIATATMQSINFAGLLKPVYQYLDPFFILVGGLVGLQYALDRRASTAGVRSTQKSWNNNLEPWLYPQSGRVYTEQ
jgi:hypothetical protein